MSHEDGSDTSNETTQAEPSQPSSNLSRLGLLPQEVFNSICINLNPKDVMCLSRVSRVLCQRTDSSNNQIWFLIFRKCQDNFDLMDRDGPYHPEYIYRRLVQRNLNRKVATCDYCGENELDMLSRLIIPNRYSPRYLPTFGRAPSSVSMRAHLGMICSVCLPKNFVRKSSFYLLAYSQWLCAEFHLRCFLPAVDDFAIFSDTGLPDMSGSDKRLLEVLRVQHLEGVINLIPSQDLRQGSQERSDVCFHWISEPDWQQAKLRRRMNPFYLPKRDIQELVKIHKGFLSTDPRDYATLIFAAIQTLYESEYINTRSATIISSRLISKLHSGRSRLLAKVIRSGRWVVSQGINSSLWRTQIQFVSRKLSCSSQFDFYKQCLGMVMVSHWDHQRFRENDLQSCWGRWSSQEWMLSLTSLRGENQASLN